MNPTISPASVEELVEVVRSNARVLAVGSGTKPRLCEGEGATIAMTRLSGIIEYEPSEFTFTALAGTPVRDIAQALAESGQYLPFDPILARAGATLGGTVATGLSGPGRFRYGGLRDFILGGRFIDGSGRLLRMGGKVVKNAAGFDLPKFFVGSLGRFGVLVELAFKVFPRPVSLLTVKIPAPDAGGVARIIMDASRTRWELDALDAVTTENAVFMRLGGPRESNEALAAEILARWPGEVVEDAESWWMDRAEFAWTHAGGALASVPLTPSRLTHLCDSMRGIDDARMHVSAGGNIAFISLPSADGAALHSLLCEQKLGGLLLRGEGPLHLGEWHQPEIMHRVKAVLDPDHRFPSLPGA